MEHETHHEHEHDSAVEVEISEHETKSHGHDADVKVAIARQNPFLIPAAIVVAGGLIAGAVLYSNAHRPVVAQPTSTQPGQPDPNANAGFKVAPLSAQDHVRGNPSAPVTLIEFSDFQCPFCARFHPTLNTLLDEFPNDIKWVYRQLPLDSIHPGAVPAAVASECIAEQKGNNAFWAFADENFSNQDQIFGSNDPVTIKAALRNIARGLGANVAAYDTCLASGKYEKLITDQSQDAQNAGARGTPHTVIVAKNGKAYPLTGALPIDQVRSVIQQAIADSK